MISRTELENFIKIQADSSWLTPSQLSAYEELNIFLNGLHRIVNLYGIQGSGKTFIAHILYKGKVVDYEPSPDGIRNSELPLAIDNANIDRTFARGMRNQMRKHNLRKVLLITRYRVEDFVPAVKLEIEAHDLECFRGNLFRHFDIKLPECNKLNLWEHLKLIGEVNE